jgi:large subunit ribosomal protein L13
MKTFTAKPETVKRDWYVVDATGKTLGRLASELALRLRGKHKAEYTPHVDTGDYIIVLNADKVAVTGNKRTDKVYYHHTGHIGGIKQATFEEMIARRPERVIEIAVKGMLPKGPLGRAMFRKLKVYVATSTTTRHSNRKFLTSNRDYRQWLKINTTALVAAKVPQLAFSSNRAVVKS